MAEELRLAVGQVSYAGPEGCGVWFDREYRELPLFGPAGIRYQPREGQRALLLSGRVICMRPRAVAGKLAVDLPRPRCGSAVTKTAEFAAARERLLALMGGEVEK